MLLSLSFSKLVEAGGMVLVAGDEEVVGVVGGAGLIRLGVTGDVDDVAGSDELIAGADRIGIDSTGDVVVDRSRTERLRTGTLLL